MGAPPDPGRRAPFAHPDTLSAAAVAVTLAGWHASSSDAAWWSGLGFAVLLVGVLWAAGTLLGRVLDPDRELPWSFPLAFSAGALAVSLVALALRFTVPVEPWIVLAGLGAAALAGLRWRRRPAPRPGTSIAPLVATVASCIATTLWVAVNLEPFVPGQGGLVYRAWPESFVLSQAILLMEGSALPQAVGDPEFAGASLPLYHYGGFVLGGGYASFTGTSALAAIDGFVIPFALLLVPLSAYALGAYLWGPWAGLGALAAAFLLPDASLYGFANPLFGYHFLLRTSPSMAWGVACGTLAVLLLAAGSREGRRRLLVGGGVAAVLCFNFKAQIFALATPIAALWLCLSRSAGRPAVRVALLALVIAAGGLAALQMGRLQLGPDFAFDPELGRTYLERASGFQPDPQRRERLAGFFAGLPTPAVPAAGSLYLLAASFGALPLIYVALLAHRARTRSFRADDLLPLILVVTYLGFALFMGTGPTGPYYELQHRPFVWVYAVLAAWTGGGVAAWLSRRWPLRLGWIAVFWVLVPVPALLAGTTDGRRLPLPRDWFDVPFAGGYLECAEYARVHAPPESLVQDSALDPRLYTLGLTERRAYLARPSRRAGDRDRGVAETIRRDEIERLAAAATPEALAAAAARLPVRYFLVHPTTRLAWPAVALADPACAAGGYRLFDLAGVRGDAAPREPEGPALAPHLDRDEPVTLLTLDPGLGVGYLRALHAWNGDGLEAVNLHEDVSRRGRARPVERAVRDRLRDVLAGNPGQIVLARREPAGAGSTALERILESLGATTAAIGVHPADGGPPVRLSVVENPGVLAARVRGSTADWQRGARLAPEMAVRAAGLYRTAGGRGQGRGRARLWVKVDAPRPTHRLYIGGALLAARISGDLLTGAVPGDLLAGRDAVEVSVWDVQAGLRSPPFTVDLQRTGRE